MSTNDLVMKVEQLKELENLLEEVKVEAEAIRDEIKQEMMARDTEELEAGKYIVRWTSIRRPCPRVLGRKLAWDKVRYRQLQAARHTRQGVCSTTGMIWDVCWRNSRQSCNMHNAFGRRLCKR